MIETTHVEMSEMKTLQWLSFILRVVAQWKERDRWKGVLPGLDRGASEDLSLQALKSDAVLWKTKGTGRGTNMVLCRPGGRCFFFFMLVSLFFFSYPSSCCRSLVFLLMLPRFVDSRLWGRWDGLEKKEDFFLLWIEPVSQRIHISVLVFLLEVWLTDGYCGPVTRVFSESSSPAHTHVHTALCGARSEDFSALGE